MTSRLDFPVVQSSVLFQLLGILTGQIPGPGTLLILRSIDQGKLSYSSLSQSSFGLHDNASNSSVAAGYELHYSAQRPVARDDFSPWSDSDDIFNFKVGRSVLPLSPSLQRVEVLLVPPRPHLLDNSLADVPFLE